FVRLAAASHRWLILPASPVRTRPSRNCHPGRAHKSMNANLFSRLFDDLQDPEKVAIETSDGERVTYRDLVAMSGRIANHLLTQGVKAGDRVAVQAEKSVASLVLYLATVRAGAIYLPLNTAYTLNELNYFITDAEPSLVVCDPSKHGGVAAI